MLCPKCHQPLDDGDEPYICCADSVLQWRCARCAKISEGFAFPYGACPHCGGALERVDPRTVTEVASVTAVRTALEIELGGQAFYRRAAAESQDPQLRALFSRFAEMEGEHLETLKRRYHLPAVAAADQLAVDAAAIFAGIASRPEDPLNLFRIAIAAEERAAQFFADHALRVASGSPEQQLYRELAAEERDHAAILATELERWSAGRPGLMS